ncbi:hypothetical protein FI667_g551, partial [Globisporangium splendens]
MRGVHLTPGKIPSLPATRADAGGNKMSTRPLVSSSAAVKSAIGLGDGERREWHFAAQTRGSGLHPCVIVPPAHTARMDPRKHHFVIAPWRWTNLRQYLRIVFGLQIVGSLPSTFHKSSSSPPSSADEMEGAAGFSSRL